jgi:hypothetical protein
MDRETLIDRILEENARATFQFTRPWLERQWTSRLRTLLLAVRQQEAEGLG